MSIQHLISIDREARLSMDTGRLKIAFTHAGEEHFIAACDIAVLMLAHPCISLSLAVQQELAAQGAVVVYANDKYMPCAMGLPIGKNMDGARRPFFQAKYLQTDISAHWWKQLVEAKILGQALSAAGFDEELSNRLKLIARAVEPGDKTAREGSAAQIYWPEFFHSIHNPVDFRDKQGAADPVNISLNYGYAVLRAIIARGLSGAGLCLNFGVGHCRKDNPFNLADDFIEPFRYLVDQIVWRLAAETHISTFDKNVKKELLKRLLVGTVNIAGKNYRLFHGVDFAVNSFCLSLEDPRRKLLLPNQFPRPGKSAQANLWQAEQFIHDSE